MMVFGVGVAQIEHIVDHFPFPCLYYAVLVAYINNGAEFVLCQALLSSHSDPPEEGT